MLQAIGRVSAFAPYSIIPIMRRFGGWICVGLMMVVMMGHLPSPSQAKSKNKWEAMDYEKLDKEWEEGDDEEFVKSDHDLKMERIQKAREEGPKFDPR